MVVFRNLIARLEMKHFALTLTVALTLTSTLDDARADVLFEGYSKVLLGGQHVGFTVQRYEFDPKKKEFSTIYFLKTNATGGNIQESLKARANSSLNPVSYQYTELAGQTPRTIDATFKGETMTTVSVANGARSVLPGKKIPKGAFLASFLGYLMLQGKEGIKTGVKYSYQAIAEEDGNLHSGEAFIAGEETMNGISVFKVLNTFKGSQYISYVTHKGEVIGTKSPAQQITTELVASIQEATAGLSVNTNTLAQLFGAVPKGTENAVARRRPGAPLGAPAAGTTAPAPAATTLGAGGTEAAPTASAPPSKQQVLNPSPAPQSDSPKTQGLPGGQGIIIKPGAPQPSAKDGKQ